MTFLLHDQAFDRAPSWTKGIALASDLGLGAACIVAAALLIFLLRRFQDSPGRAAYLPCGAVLGITGAAHLARAFGLVSDSRALTSALQVSRAMYTIGMVILLGNVALRVTSLVDREREAQRRETDLTAVLAELSAAYGKLRDLTELKTQVFANVSHELRTPLTLILGPIQALRDTAELSAEQRAALAIVDRNAQLLLGHVNDLLELSRADAVGVALNVKPSDYAAVLRSAASSFRPLAHDLGVAFEVDVRPAAKAALIDPEKLERIAMNLLANAFKFTPRGGKVRMRAWLEETPRDAHSGPELVVVIDDSGPGIRVEDRELVFERFRQLDGKPNRAFSGTGLGLAIVKEFVTACGGSVRVEDSPLAGARLMVRVPCELSESVVDSDADSLPQSSSSAEMLALRSRPLLEPDSDLSDLPLVLVVEDNPDMNRFVSSSLSGEFQVASAYDGHQALARLETLNPDLIVTDFMMPHMSGDEFVRALRSIPALFDVPVLVLTARDDIELRVRVLSDGVQDWLTKPFTMRELVARARNLISARRARTILRAELTTREFDVGELARQLAQRKRQLESLLGSLSQALEEAELASRFKTSLLRLVSHELRTPLGAIQLQLERLSGEHRGPLNDAQQQLIMRMRRSFARLTDTIQSLLEYARIESGRLDLTVQTFDLRELLRSVIDDFGPQAEQKGLNLRLEIPEGDTQFDSDERLLRLVLVNLVANALKFTESGEVTVSVKLSSDGCQVCVRDTGPGIDPSVQTSVFEPFFRGESANHQQYSQGVGLGLSLVTEMLHALGGTIELQSALGTGSTFRVSVPRAHPPVSGHTQRELQRNSA